MPLDLHESVRLMGGFRWVELQLFELLGSLATNVREPSAKTMLGTHCHHHAWHAELWAERLPALRGVDLETVTTPANDGLAAAFAALGEPTATLDRLAGIYRVVLPRLVVTYDSLLSVIDGRTDGPTVRALTLILRDDHDQWHAGEREIQRLIHTGDDVTHMAAHQAKVESILVAAGGFAAAAGRTPV